MFFINNTIISYSQMILDINVSSTNNNISQDDYIIIYEGKYYLTSAKNNARNIFHIQIEEKIDNFDSVFFYFIKDKEKNKFFLKNLNLFSNNINNYTVKILKFEKFQNKKDLYKYIRKNKTKYNYNLLLPGRKKSFYNE